MTGRCCRRPAGQAARLDRVDLGGVQVRYLPVGSAAADNVGIVAFNARRYPRNKLSFEMFMEVVNNRDKDAEVDLQIFSDNRLIETQRLRLKAGTKSRYICDPDEEDKERTRKAWCRLAASGEFLEARLVPPGSTAETAAPLDVFPADDRAFSLLPRRRKQKVSVITPGNLFLEGAVLLDESLDVTRVPPAAYSPAQVAGADALIFDRYFPAVAPRHNYIVILPPMEKGPFKVDGALERPIITEQSTGHPVMRWVTLKDVNISASLRFVRQPGVQVLASSFRSPLVVARDAGGQKSVAIGFDITKSDLPMRVAFPLLIINSLDWFSGASQGLVTSYRTGKTWSVPVIGAAGASTGQIKVVSPRGRVFKVALQNGRATFAGRETGLYKLTHDRGQVTRIAANLADPVESDVKPRRPLIMGDRVLQPPAGFGVSMKRELWIYFLLAALGIMLLEWLTYNRRVTV